MKVSVFWEAGPQVGSALALTGPFPTLDAAVCWARQCVETRGPVLDISGTFLVGRPWRPVEAQSMAPVPWGLHVLN